MATPCHEIRCTDCTVLNAPLTERFYALKPEQFERRTHLFNGRYENIYVSDETLPELAVLKQFALRYAARILNLPSTELQCICWLNDMGPGDLTLPHTHDDDDELLSAVYYVATPEQSGKLVIWEKEDKYTIEPEPGKFVFFAPDKKHEVTKNNSSLHRLSVAFNFGRGKPA